MEMTFAELRGLPWQDTPRSNNLSQVAFVPEHRLTPNEESRVGKWIGCLYVEFRRGRAIYAYGNVLEETVRVMLEAQSIGSFFGEHIPPEHPCERVIPVPA